MSICCQIILGTHRVKLLVNDSGWWPVWRLPGSGIDLNALARSLFFVQCLLWPEGKWSELVTRGRDCGGDFWAVMLAMESEGVRKEKGKGIEESISIIGVERGGLSSFLVKFEKEGGGKRRWGGIGWGDRKEVKEEKCEKCWGRKVVKEKEMLRLLQQYQQ